MREELDISPAEATQILRRFYDPERTVYRVRQLNGGVVNHVAELHTDGNPESIVAKINVPAHAQIFRREAEALAWYREHTSFPVPEPYTVIDWAHAPGAMASGGVNGSTAEAAEPKRVEVSGLLMSYVDGPNLGDARITTEGYDYVQRDLARHLTLLHGYRGDCYGNALDETGHATWADAFRPMIAREFKEVRDQLSSRARWIITDVIDKLEEWLPETDEPTLVHGDLWATNILVDDRFPSRPAILAFVDCGAIYADVEYELAYLTLFRTVNELFFRDYGHKLRSGFDRRCRVYWLNTMMLHVRMFGDRYLPSCEELARQLKQLS